MITKYIFPLSWALLVTCGSLLPGQNLISLKQSAEINIPHLYLHCISYGVLTLLILWSIQGWTTICYTKINFKIFVWICMYGLLIELLQEFLVPGRDFEISDLVMNSMGVIIGTIIYFTLRTIYFSKTSADTE